MRVFADLFTPSRRGWRPLAVLLLCAAAGLAQAQSTGDDNTAPPDRVARLSYVSGDLGFLPAGTQDWSSADINRPLTTGDRLSTGDDSRAELELGGGSLRMASNTDFGLLNLNDQQAQVELTRGTLNLSVRHLDQGQSYEIDTPTVALVVSQPGTFRVDVDSNGNGTRVSVFSGQATVYGENNAQRDVFAGRRYQFDDSSLSMVALSDIGVGDDFDAWWGERDQRYAQSTTRRYVSDDVIGYQDLDDYGSWQSTSEYGAVWYPSQVPVDWAPYRNGHWAYIAPWGWTWVDDAPWGFAPYHYGRWVWIGGAWGWIPGPVVARPVYAPALVAFVGGGGWGVSIGFGGAPVGWFPLGPGEVYNPWYHCDRDYYRRVNVTNIYVNNTTINRTTVINNINNQYNYYNAGRPFQAARYANRAAPHAVTAVSAQTFASAQRVQRNMLRVDERQIAAAPVLARGVTALQPTVRSVAPVRNLQARPLPIADFRRNVVAHTPPPTKLPVVHAAFAPATARAPQRATTPFSNVRVLNERNNQQPVRTMQPETARANPGQPRQMSEMSRSVPPPNSARATATLPVVRPIEPAASLRQGELPSARFAHPQPVDRNMRVEQPNRAPTTTRVEQAPRPGVSYIAGPSEYRPQPESRSTATLPQPPRIERAPAAVPTEPTHAPSYTESRVPPYQPALRVEPMREPTPPRTESAYNPPRPVYQPEPREYARPAYQAPIEQPRYAMPRQVMEAPPHAAAPAHAEPAPRRAPPPPHKDDQQH